MPTHVPRWIADELNEVAQRQDGRTKSLGALLTGRRPRLHVRDDRGAKGAVLSHANFAVNAGNLVRRGDLPDDRYSPRSRLSRARLGNGVCGWLASGCSHAPRRRFDAKRAAPVVRRMGPTRFRSADVYFRMLDWPPDE